MNPNPARLQLLGPHVRMRHPIFVGEAPSRHGDASKPITGECGRSLADLAGLSFPNGFCRSFGRINLLDEWPGPSPGGAGSGFDFAAGIDSARQLLEYVAAGTLVLNAIHPGTVGGVWTTRLVLLGRRVEFSVLAAVARARTPQPWFQWWEAHPRLLVATMPHPSHVSRWWKDPTNVLRAGGFLASALAAT